MPVRRPDRAVGRNYRSSNGEYKSAGRHGARTVDSGSLRRTEATSQQEKAQATRQAHEIDERMGFPRYEAGRRRVGWLCNMHSTQIEDVQMLSDSIAGMGRAAVDYYFIEEDGSTFKATLQYDPYMLIAVRRGREAEVEEWIRRKFEGHIRGVKRRDKEDLSMPNHLLGYRRGFLELSFLNVGDLLAARKVLLPIAEKNKLNMNAMDAYAEVASANAGFDMFDDQRLDETRPSAARDPSDFIVDMREYDVPYHVRVAIDKDIRIGKWYTVEAKHGVTTMTCLEERLQRADPVVLAFDIETTKLPLKFPDQAIDQVMMISYMIDGNGFLITNREIVSDDIGDLEYTPKPEYPGPFIIFNEPDERATLERFFSHIKDARPTVIATYNGDFFDWPFVEARASVNGIDMYQEIGFRRNSENVFQSDYCVHMDCFAWVNRDSYLPQGSRGLKAVTVAKLGYEPDELDPELMTPYASEKPQVLAQYSVSDAVATYYLYMKYVHPFIFSLCTIIPLNPDDTLRKGTGTLCEMLLMVQAYQHNIVLPNKHKEPRETFWEGHLLESETYVGGHVESLEAGVFRSDIPYNFAIDPSAIEELIRDLDAALTFSITVEEKKSLEDVTNYDEIKQQIIHKLRNLQSTPNRNERPSIYHLDVASMYPNIMTTNRLQPDSMVQESDCAACDFNRPGKTCDRRLPWAWRGEFLPAQKNEYNMIRHALENEKFPGKTPASLSRTFQELAVDEQASHVKKRLQDYSKKIYHKIHDAKTVEREAIICQRENPFYVNTVKNFRDRRYDFKGQQKVWKGKTDALKATGASTAEIDEAKKMIVLFDSLQLAHKVILNSFYGYVMRKGSRWYSMEMAGVTCLTGARIIQMARELVERIGRPLELDTDGIWCMLPATFPENVVFTLKNGKKLPISYPCIMLNHLVHARFTNHQYQELVDTKTFRYDTHSDNTIFFEVDGPYKAMILPTSKEEDKNLKKRYAVFNHDGSLAELKGFEVKRRGELKLIKIFQTQIFKYFLEGANLPETYAAVARVANRWLDVLDQRGAGLTDDELMDLICENKSMTKTLEEYGKQKSTAITTATRLAEFLGQQMIKDKGLNCKYIIAARPRNAPVTERAIPTAIFSAEETIKRHFLRKWMKEEPGDMDPRTILDWEYYRERLGSVIQKLITIPAALQKIRNPVPRIVHPDWLQQRLNVKDDKFKQRKVTDHFTKQPLAERAPNILDHHVATDLEDFGSSQVTKAKAVLLEHAPKRKSPEPAAAPALHDPYNALPTIMPDPSEDYRAFLRYQKQKWAIQKKARERRRQLFGDRAVGATDLGGFFRNQAAMLYSSTWQVLQLQDSDIPGIVRAHVLIGNKIQILKIRVPRQVFLNLKCQELPDVVIDGCNVEKVTHTLPNGHPSVHLFKLTLSEETYVGDTQEINALFHHPSVEGVYETQITPQLRAALALNTCCTFDESQAGALGRGLEQGFELTSLRKSSSGSTYLETIGLAFYFLYHVVAGDRQVFALFSTTQEEATIVVSSRSSEARDFPSADKAYIDLFNQKVREQDSRAWQKNFEYAERVRFTVKHAGTQRKALAELSSALKRLQKDEVRPMLLVLQSIHPTRLVQDLPSLKDLPILSLKIDASDASFPPLGWQTYVVKKIITNYLALDSWITHLVELARYGDIPLCNLERDDPRFLIDVTYARKLQKNNIVLWWSSEGQPDHAGFEKDDVTGSLHSVDLPTINTPGTFSSVSIELDVRNLAINTILTSSLINELEGSESFSMSAADGEPSDGTGVLYSASAFAPAGLAVLREMVKAWWSEACQGSTMADILVSHLVRWVESPSSRLYDRSLHQHVRMMSRKAFQQLMTDFRRVGSNIIFANANRLILQTTKNEIGNAYAYCQYIVKSIKAKPLFHFLDLDVREYWDYLAWYDEWNYGGKATQEVSSSDEQSLETIMHWQLATFLPAAYQKDFRDWVLEFIDLMHSHKRPQASLSGEATRLTQIPFQSLTKDDDTGDDAPEEVRVELDRVIARPLKKHLATLMAKHRAKATNDVLAADYTYPSLPGMSDVDLAQTTHPVLQLAKSLFCVYGLDRSLNLSVRALRRDCLALFDVREFSAAGRFINPSRSLPLDWTCAECTLPRTLELCRDADLLPLAVPSASGNEMMSWQQQVWRCSHCHTPYPRRAIEEHLIAEAQRLVVAWATQDLQCTKCHNIRLDAHAFMEHCSCAGVWGPTLNLTQMTEKLKVLAGVAAMYGMELLGQAVQEIQAE